MAAPELAGWLAGIRTAWLRKPGLRSCGICGQRGGFHGRPAWQTSSVRHGFIWEGHRDIFHRDAVHDGGERVQVVGVSWVSCEQVICKEKVGGCYLGGEGAFKTQDRE